MNVVLQQGIKQLELDMEQQTDAVCCHPAYLTPMQSTS